VRYQLIFLAWLLVAIAAGVSGLPARLHPPFPQVVLLTLTALLITAGATWRPFRAWLFFLSWQQLLSFHLSRFVGFYFIYLCKQGQLACSWAMPSGIGDVVVALLAAVLLVTKLPNTRPWLLTGWNILGLADIVAVVVRAATTALHDPNSMAALLRLPLSLLVTFLVPIIIASHILILAKRGQTKFVANVA